MLKYRERKRDKFLARVEVYVGVNHDWYWSAISTNGNIVAISGEGYKNFVDCRKIAELLFPNTKLNIVQVPTTVLGDVDA